METATGDHYYWSTACFHGKHEYCNAMIGYQGQKRPAQCKFCDARCQCLCHIDTPSNEKRS